MFDARAACNMGLPKDLEPVWFVAGMAELADASDLRSLRHWPAALHNVELLCI
jgi:hypothetical protein